MSDYVTAAGISLEEKLYSVTTHVIQVPYSEYSYAYLNGFMMEQMDTPLSIGEVFCVCRITEVEVNRPAGYILFTAVEV